MIPQNESAATAGESSSHQVVSGGSDSAAIPVTRARLRVKDNFRHNRVVIIGAGVLVVAFLLFVAVAAPRHNTSKKTTTSGTLDYTKPQSEDDPSPSEHSVLPIIDARQPKPALKSENLIDENAVERTASQPIVSSKPARPSPVVQEQTLSSIPPFPNQWQAPPFSQRTSVTQISQEKPEHDDLQKSSFAYVRTAAVGATNTFLPKTSPEVQVVPGLGLPTGTRLRARLESAVSTGLRAPVIAVIEYNYEHGGDLIVPAGAKAIGHIQQADRSGYLTIEFENLVMPDESVIPIQAVATDLKLGPPKGRVEGRNAKKNLLLRSLSGIGQAGALLIGRGSLDQPLSEGDMLRERVSNNIGQASDEQISRFALSERATVTIPANTSLYVVLEKTAETGNAAGISSKTVQPVSSTSIEDLRQLLQLQRELAHHP